ncbi:MAG: YraN family protein [Firmicutes bacterium]|nr:YraN family protein [Bacillota bacterium]MBP3899851.1 YraN family protein [Blautia sp.]
MKKNKRLEGSVYEERAAEWLEEQGLIILERNFRCRQGEIDLIALDEDVLVFVEIKYRRTRNTGFAIEAVNPRKQAVIRRVAQYYLLKKRKSENVPCRFDVLGFDGARVTWIKNAYEERR